MALALQTVLDDLGKGLGPLLVSLMVSAWGACVPSLHRVLFHPRLIHRGVSIESLLTIVRDKGQVFTR